MINKERLVSTFIEMVKISSPSGYEENVKDYILKQIGELDIELYEDNCGEILNTNCGNLIIRVKGNTSKKILFSAHMDTVTPCENVNPIIEGNIIKSDGTTILGADDKAGIASIIEMVRVLKENNINHPEIIIVFTVCEEIGLKGAMNVDLSKFNKIDYGYVLDGGSKPGICFNQAPYSANGTYEIIGKEAHAGIAPENGINAFVVASEAVSKLKIGRIDEETTCNIGVVQGGIASNVVMPKIEMQFEARSLCEKKLDSVLENVEKVFTEVCEKHNAVFINTVKKGTPGFKISDKCETINILSKAADTLGFEFNALPSGGGSDTNIYNMMGINSINIATGMSNVHTKEEYIEIDDLVNTTRLIIEIAKESING